MSYLGMFSHLTPMCYIVRMNFEAAALDFIVPSEAPFISTGLLLGSTSARGRFRRVTPRSATSFCLPEDYKV